MPTYRPQGVTVNVVDNPRIINIAGQARIPAVIGLGPTSLSVVDEAVVKGASGATDYLAAYSATTAGVTVTKISTTPSVASGSLAYALVTNNGALYQLSSASVTGAGAVTWTGDDGSDANVPSVGATYYVSYTYNSPSTQYDPKTSSDKDTLLSLYGVEGTDTGILTIAGTIALENGSPAVITVQASGSVYSEAAYKTAIDKLQTKKNINYICVVFPSGSVTRANQETLLTYAYSHVVTMNNAGRERGLACGSPSPYSASDGIDTIGDAETSATYLYRANALTNKNVLYVVPSRIRRKDASNNWMELDSNYGAVAVAGLRAAQPRHSQPLHGQVIAGLVIEDEKWNEFQMNQLGGGGCLVLESRSGLVTIRDCITTDGTSANTQEESIADTERYVKTVLRDSLRNQFTSKGKVIGPTTTIDVENGTAAILQSLVNTGEIYAFGQVDDPSTGETKISAKQNRQEPRQIDVTCSVKWLYPFKFISVTVSVYI